MRFLAALVLATPLYGQLCTYLVDKTAISLPYTATPATVVNVTATPSSCRWQANVDTGSAGFLHLTQASQQTVTGSGSFTFSTDVNPLGTLRTGSITVFVQDTLSVFISIKQDAAPCNFSFSPSSQNFSIAGGNGSVQVTANCAWAVSNNVGNWLTISPGTAGGTISATVPFTVASNGCVTSRSGTLILNGSALAKPLISTVTQDGSPDNFSLSGNNAAADATASDGRFGVNTGTGCGWSASSDVSWMQITGGVNGTGNGNIAYHLIANTSATRTGSIHVNAGGGVQLVYTVTQAAPGPPAPIIASVNNAANYSTGAVSPGEIITIFGQNMGPASIVPLQVSNGLLNTNLSGTQVLFDGVAAPMVYALKTQVSAVAPYGLAGKGSTQLQVSYNGTLSDPVTIPVQDTTPAIFTLDSSGLGPGAVLNQDFSVNTSAVPAARGSVVAIYCTGGGAMNPAVADGAIISAALPRLTQPVAVTIGGFDAKVSYSGGVPSSIAGLTQVNAEVPAGVTPGSKVGVTVKIGSVTSSAGVTIAVK